jgi:hypothetical protein
MQKVRLEAEEGNDLGTDLSLDCPPAPVVEIRFKVQMNESVAQWPRHGEVNATLGGRIPGCDDNPAIGQHILAELPVQYQLIAARLGHLRRRGQLIEKEDAFACGGKELGRHPFGLVLGDPRQTPEIDRVELHGPHIEKVVVEVVGDLGNDLGFPDAAGTPDVQGHTFTNQRMERLMELRWFHGCSLVNSKLSSWK